MAIDVSTQFEVNSNGDYTNGAGFADLDPGTSMDYSQQYAPELDLNDVAMVAGGTTITSVTGGFTPAMVGNCININSGTNFVGGFYQITGYNSGNSVEIDRDATDGSDATVGQSRVGGASERLNGRLLEAAVGGNTIWVKNDGEIFQGGANVAGANGGSATAYIKVYGYNSTRGDNPTGTDRPTVNCQTKRLEFGDYVGGYWDVRNIIFDATGPFGIEFDGHDSHVENCKMIINGGIFSDGIGIYEDGCRVIDCEVSYISGSGSSEGISFYYYLTEDVQGVIDGCYVEGVSFGLEEDYGGLAVFDTITNDCYQNHIGQYGYIKNCTFHTTEDYGGALDGIVAYGEWQVVLNCIFQNLARSYNGAYTAISSQYHYLDYNDWIDNEEGDLYYDWPFTKGKHALAVDPDFVGSDSENFKLNNTSPLINAGMAIRDGVR